MKLASFISVWPKGPFGSYLCLGVLVLNGGVGGDLAWQCHGEALTGCSAFALAAVALQILRVILVTVPPPPLWLWSAGAPDLEGDPCHGAAAPPVVMERWRWRS